MTQPLISLDIRSGDALRLLQRAPDALATALDGALNDASALMLRELTTYPAQRPGSTYRRTRNLGRSWSRKFEGSGLDRRVLVGSNQNMAPYNRAVQDETQQASVHRGRWTNTVQNVLRSNERDVQRMLEQRVAAEMTRIGA